MLPLSKFRRWVLALVVLQILLPRKVAVAHSSSSYNEELVQVAADYNDWMSLLDDETVISEISMPGTHDTMSQCVSGSACALPVVYDYTRTQSMTLRQQLDSGIRALDLRIRYQDGALQDCSETRDDCSLVLYHGIMYQAFTMESDVIPVLKDFLDANPSELIIMRLKEEGSPDNPQLDIAVWTMLETIQSYLVTSGTTKLGDGRGKITVLNEFIDVPAQFETFEASLLNITWNDIRKQDEFSLESHPSLYDKWLAIKNYFSTSAGDESVAFHANFLSASGVVTPPFFVASGHAAAGNGSPRLWTGLKTPFFADAFPDFPRTSCFLGLLCKIAYEGTNVLAADYLLNNQVNGNVGMVFSDFTGARLIAAIILQNEGTAGIDVPDDNATTARCGLFGWSIFCPFTGCGILGRLFGLCGNLL